MEEKNPEDRMRTSSAFLWCLLLLLILLLAHHFKQLQYVFITRHVYIGSIYLSFISYIEKSPKPYGISVFPSMRPIIKPNSIEINISKASDMKPAFFDENDRI